MQCKEVEGVLEQEGFVPVPEEARAHLAGCSSCQNLIAARNAWWNSFSEFFRPRVLATAAVVLLIVAATALQLQRPAAQSTEARNANDILYRDTSVTLTNDEAHLPAMQLAGSSDVDVSLRQNLDIVDNFIVDCEQHIKEQPQDDLTREYLSGAYQQKAELISVMMERGGSGY